MRKLSIVLTVLLSVLLAFVACDNSIDIGLNTKVEVKEIRLNETELYISTGEEATLVATVLPEDATDKSVTWSSSDEDVATVDANGKVTGVGAGEATITVTSNSDNTVYETCSVKVAVNPYEIPLTLEFKNAGKIWVNYIGANPAPVKISISGRSLEELEEDEEVSVDAGDVIRFYRDVVGAEASDPSFTINCKDSDCFVYGNAMSVLYGDQFVGKTEVPPYAFCELFMYNTHIINHDEIDLVLPATSLSENCYAFMFDGCKGLTRAPELPAETMAVGCYACMFENCTGLTRAPELPADVLASYCYFSMFYGCERLNSITCLATNISAPECTSYWVDGVAATGTFTRHPNGVTWADGVNGIPSEWDVEVYGQDNPLSFVFEKACTDAFTITNPSSSLAYSINGGDWIDYTSQSISVKAGDEVSFCSNGTESTLIKPMKINCNEDSVVYGNVMSLISKENYKTSVDLTESDVFNHLFAGDTHLKSAEGLVLPATTLSNGCYAYMFDGCTRLTTAPALSAKTLADYCYYGMFQGCKSLTTAPDLPAATLEYQSYFCMFYGCSSLNSITCLATDISASGCTTNWVSGVAATGTFTEHDDHVGWAEGPSGYPDNWTLENYCN